MTEWEWDNTEADTDAEDTLELRLRGAVAALGKSEQGLSFLRWLLDEAGVFRQDFVQDEKLAAWHAGRRKLGLQVFSLCAAENLANIILAGEYQQ